MTTSPDGELVPVETRLTEIHHRYGPGHLVSRSTRRATADRAKPRIGAHKISQVIDPLIARA